ncbi:hypothetical protein L249_3230, partial [Ophiocordyceps polyrhachis-furcata BCC 54312]
RTSAALPANADVLFKDTTRHPSKKKRLASHGRSHPDFPPRKFWEELTKIHLTKNALRALERYGSPRQTPTDREPTSDLQSAESYLRSCSPTVSKQILGSASQGGPDLEDLRGYRFTEPEHKMSARESSLGRRRRELDLGRPTQGSQSPAQNSGSRKTTTTRNTGPKYDGNFEQHLIRHRVYPKLFMYPKGKAQLKPDNLDEIRQILAQRGASISSSQFSEDAFEEFRVTDVHSAKELQVMMMVIPIIEGGLGYDPACVAVKEPLRNLNPLTDGSIMPGIPNIYYGARPEHLRPGIYPELGGHIVPSTDDSLPVVPNFFLQVKDPDCAPSVARRQACYNGALGARGIHTLQSYRRPEHYDNKAYTLTSTYQAGILKMYTSHPIPPSTPGGRPGFATTHIQTWALTGDADSFRQGVTAYRNGREWARRQRDDAISQANERDENERDEEPLSGPLGLASEAPPGRRHICNKPVRSAVGERFRTRDSGR